MDKVELVAVSSTQLPLTLRALEISMAQARFAAVKLLTHDENIVLPEGVQRIVIAPIGNSSAYSHFILKQLADHVDAEHVLVVQWDGYVLDPSAWTDDFLACDYIGARWTHFSDSYIVGNGGFSLRSKRLLKACQSASIIIDGPEDIVIGRNNRPLLEREFGIRFATPEQADAFAFERTRPIGPTFGFHGVWNMIKLLGADEFARFYTRSDRGAIGGRELRDSFLQLLRQSPIDHAPLLFRLLWDWQKARRARHVAR